MNDTRPIGVFDSGLGGLTILDHLLREFPHEEFCYLGDTARIPYGAKSPETIARYSQQNINYLQKQNVKAVVVACNSASSVIARLESDVPLFGVIEPGALQATRETKNKKVGVIGTRATVRNRAYVEALNKLDPQIEVFQQACPLLVSLVEEGWDQDPLTNLIVYRYVNPLVQQGIDTLILGCTHYPVLRNAIHKVAGNTVQLVESGFTLTALIKKQFESGQILTAGAEHRPQHRILTTDNSETFESLTRRLLPAIECRPELIHI